MFILTGLLLSHISCQTFKNSKTMDKSTVKELDINKYMGKWYEIARLPNSFEKNLVGVTADYSHLKEGRFNVVNKGYKANLNGKLKTAKGKAKIPDLNEPGKLKVSFFLFFYSDYYILELDANDYQWAMIGSSPDKYLWILSRTPQMDAEIYEMLVNKAEERGYDIKRLIKVLQ
jgi:apolipoprotein D and lipocalin family protein